MSAVLCIDLGWYSIQNIYILHKTVVHLNRKKDNTQDKDKDKIAKIQQILIMYFRF